MDSEHDRLAPLVTTQNGAVAGAVLPEGTWLVDPAAGGIGFEVSTWWGLRTVRGMFARYRGELVAGPHGATGELVIEATSIDTTNNRRNEHLRSGNFFDVAHHPEIVFTISAIGVRLDGVTISGDLRIAGTSVHLDLPVFAMHNDDHLTLHTVSSVSRARAGMTWNRLGMVRGDARLVADLELTRRA